VAGEKLVGSPLPLVPDDTDAITALGEIMPGGLLLPGQLTPPSSPSAAQAATDDATGSSGTGVGSRG
jgi:hypothetical protein